MSEEIRLVFPTIEFEAQAKEFINEFKSAEGTCGLYDSIKENDYAGWIKTVIEEMDIANIKPGMTPALTYFYIRKSDNKIAGIVKLKLISPEQAKEKGNIEFAVCSSERRKHYAINMVKDVVNMGALLGAGAPVVIADKRKTYSDEEVAAQVIVRLCGGLVITK
ncbi:GNAT family N-acetyltransferase [Agathobacter sp.]